MKNFLPSLSDRVVQLFKACADSTVPARATQDMRSFFEAVINRDEKACNFISKINHSSYEPKAEWKSDLMRLLSQYNELVEALRGNDQTYIQDEEIKKAKIVARALSSAVDFPSERRNDISFALENTLRFVELPESKAFIYECISDIEFDDSERQLDNRKQSLAYTEKAIQIQPTVNRLHRAVKLAIHNWKNSNYSYKFDFEKYDMMADDLHQMVKLQAAEELDKLEPSLSNLNDLRYQACDYYETLYNESRVEDRERTQKYLAILQQIGKDFDFTSVSEPAEYKKHLSESATSQVVDLQAKLDSSNDTISDLNSRLTKSQENIGEMHRVLKDEMDKSKILQSAYQELLYSFRYVLMNLGQKTFLFGQAKQDMMRQVKLLENAHSKQRTLSALEHNILR